MAALVIETGPLRGRRFELRERAPLDIGRDRDRAVSLPDVMVSRLHCVIRLHAGQCLLEDRGSRNGTHVNDQRVSRRRIAPGDVVRVGETLFTYATREDDPLVGKTLAGYRIEKRIGRGAVGTVYRAVQLSLDRTVAFKILEPRFAKDEEFVRRFLEEARAAGRLNHPNVVQVYDAGKHGEHYYISMEFLEKGTLEELLAEKGRVAESTALAMAVDAARALTFAEQKHIVHRDIKPANLLMAADDTVKVGDLGIASDLRSPGSGTAGGGAGSPRYMAPEQVRGGGVDHRADVYALGSTLYRTLAGRPPFDGSTVAEILRKKTTSDPPSLKELLPDLAPGVCDLVGRMMARDPDGRFASCAEMLGAMENELADLGRGTSVASPPAAGRARRRAGPFSWRSPVVQAVVASAILAVVAVVLSAFLKPSPKPGDGPPSLATSQSPAGAGDAREKKELSPVASRESPVASHPGKTADPGKTAGAELPPSAGAAREDPLAPLKRELDRISSEVETGAIDERTALGHLEEAKQRFPGEAQRSRVEARERELLDLLRKKERDRVAGEIALTCRPLVAAGRFDEAVRCLEGLEERHGAREDISKEMRGVEEAARLAWTKKLAEAEGAAVLGDFGAAKRTIEAFSESLPSNVRPVALERLTTLAEEEKRYREEYRPLASRIRDVAAAVSSADFERARSLVSRLPSYGGSTVVARALSLRSQLVKDDLTACEKAWEKLVSGVRQAIRDKESLSLAFVDDPSAAAEYRVKGLEGSTLELQSAAGRRSKRSDLFSVAVSHLTGFLKRAPSDGGSGRPPEIPSSLLEGLGLLLLYRDDPAAQSVLLDPRLGTEKNAFYRERLGREQAEHLRHRLSHIGNRMRNGESSATAQLERWNAAAEELSRLIASWRWTAGYRRARAELAEAFLEAKTSSLRAALPESLFRGAVESYKKDRSIVLSYRFLRPEEAEDFLPVDVESRILEGEGAVTLRGEFRFCGGNPFKESIMVQGKIPKDGYKANAPNIHLALWTRDGDRVAPLRAGARAPAVKSPPRALVASPPSDYLVVATGLAGRFVDGEQRVVRQLAVSTSGAPVSMPANAVFGGARGRSLLTYPKFECLWAAHVKDPFAGALQFEVRVTPDAPLSWRINRRKVPLKELRALDIFQRPEGRIGSITFFTCGGIVTLDSLRIESVLNEDWVERRLRDLAEAALREFEPRYPFPAGAVSDRSGGRPVAPSRQGSEEGAARGEG